MASPFVGEIRPFPYNFVPNGWFACDGRTLLISEYTKLFAYIGANYGGDGRVNFMLPDLRGRVLVGGFMGGAVNGWNPGRIGTYGGAETVALTPASVGVHQHVVQVSDQPSNAVRAGSGVVLGGGPTSSDQFFGVASSAYLTALNTDVITSVGGGEPRPNMQPFLVLQFCISTVGDPPPHP